MPSHKGGQPPLDPQHPSVSVHVRVPGPQYDALYHQASVARVTVPELIRRLLARPEPPADDEDA